MQEVKLGGLEAEKPLAVDSQGKLLTLKDLKKGKGVIALATLDPKLQRDLVLKRNEMEPDYEISKVSGERITKAQLMKEIEEGTDLGSEAVRAEVSYLSDIQKELAGELEPEEKLPETIDLGPWPPKEYRWVPKKWWPIFFRRLAVFAEDTDTGITKNAADYRKKYVIPCFPSRKIFPIVLTGVNDTRPNFAAACRRPRVVYISGIGHGSPTAYTGYNLNHLWDACQYDPSEVKGKIVHLLSCLTAQQLGPDLVNKGACAYFGYFESFYITWAHPSVFWRCDSAIDLALCRGYPAGVAAKIAMAVFKYWITKMKGPGGHGPTAVWLTHDLKALRTPIHGNQYGSPQCTLRKFPFFEELEEELSEAEMEELEEVEEETLDPGGLIAELTEDVE